MARLVTLMGELSGDQTTAQAMRLVFELAALAETLAELREARHRLHQAEAARATAAILRSYTPTSVRRPARAGLRHTDPAQPTWRQERRAEGHGR